MTSVRASVTLFLLPWEPVALIGFFGTLYRFKREAQQTAREALIYSTGNKSVLL
jgi:hypothetical protein